MFNRELKRNIRELNNTVFRHDAIAQSVISNMQRTAFRQEEAIVALKKEAAIHIEKLISNGMNITNLLNLTYELENSVGSLLKVIKTSGIVEEAAKGEDIFQFRNTVDILQRNPLYKINKVVTIKEKL